MKRVLVWECSKCAQNLWLNPFLCLKPRAVKAERRKATTGLGKRIEGAKKRIKGGNLALAMGREGEAEGEQCRCRAAKSEPEGESMQNSLA